MLTLGEEQYLDEKWAATHQQMLAGLGHETLCETSLLRQMMSDHEWAYDAAPILAELFRAVGADDKVRVLIAASRLHLHAMATAMKQVDDEAREIADDAVRGDA